MKAAVYLFSDVIEKLNESPDAALTNIIHARHVYTIDRQGGVSSSDMDFNSFVTFSPQFLSRLTEA